MTEYQFFTKLPQISHIHIIRNFSSIFANFLDQLLHPYKFHGRDMSGILFFIFASCEPLTKIKANTVYTCLLCEIFENINLEHVEFDEEKSQFLSFLVVYHILSETEI